MTEAATTPTPSPSPTPSPTPAANAAWYGELPADRPQEFRDWVANKQYKDPVTALESNFNLEKLLGADKAGRTVVLPKDENDVEGRKAFHAKLGVPESPDKYELPLPDGDDGSLAKVAAEWFHKSGVPKGAAQEITKQWNEHIGAIVKADQDAAKLKADGELNALRGEWGDKAKANEEFARRGSKAYGAKAGLDDNDMNALESSLGTAKMLKLFLTLGQTTAESTFAGEGGGGGFEMTKSVAQSKLADIQKARAAGTITDSEWKTSKQAEFERLSQIAHGT